MQRAWVLSLALLLAPWERSVRAAEQHGAQAQAPPVFASDVSLVAVPVFVADRDGKATGGLLAQDFQLYEDGKPVRILSFEEVDTTSPASQEAVKQLPAARRHFLLLFDLSFTSPSGLFRAREAAEDFLARRLAPSDLAAVATFDVNRGIRLIANFTEDRGLLAKAVRTLGAPSFTQLEDPLALAAMGANEADVLAPHRAGADLLLDGQAFVVALARRFQALQGELYRNHVKALMAGLKSLGTAVRRVEGRKQVVFFSAGFETDALVGDTTTSGMQEAAEAFIDGRVVDIDGDARFGDVSVRREFSSVARALSNADCVVHAMHVTGLGAGAALDQTAASKDPGRPDAGRESLNYLAAETGGRFFKDTNDLAAALREVDSMTARYYVLGYQPENLGKAGRFHKLKVRVLRKDTKVSHRAGYFEETAKASRTALEKKFDVAQLVMTAAGENDLHFSALCLPFPSRGERQTLALVLQVRREEIPWREPFGIEVYGYAVAEDGSVEDHLAQFARVEPSRAEMAQGLSFAGTLSVRPGRYTLKLLVLAGNDGPSGVQFLEVTVPPREPREGFLLPPVLLDDPGRWLPLVVGDFPLLLGGQALVPRTSSRVEPGVLQRLVLVAYDPERPLDPAASVQINSMLTDSGGQLMPEGPLRIERVDRSLPGRRTYILGFTPTGLPPGDYTLRVAMGDGGSRIESHSRLRVDPGP